MKTCKFCGEEKQLTEFYTNGKTDAGTIKYRPACKLCHNSDVKSQKANRLEEILSELDLVLECNMCGYKKNKAALCFHHVDSEEKDFSFSGMKMFTKEKLLSEIEKCVILCCNCHMEHHYPHMDL